MRAIEACSRPRSKSGTGRSQEANEAQQREVKNANFSYASAADPVAASSASLNGAGRGLVCVAAACLRGKGMESGRVDHGGTS